MTTFSEYRNWTPRRLRQSGSSQASIARHLPRPFRNELVSTPPSFNALSQQLLDSDNRASTSVVPNKVRELDCVRLLGELTTPLGLVPFGEMGTIVYRYPRGEAFEVEFDTPFSLVVTLRAEEIEEADA